MGVMRLFAGQPASFPSPFSPEEAARQLSASVKPTILRAMLFSDIFHGDVVGEVTLWKVRLYRYRFFLFSALRPTFVGVFGVRNGKTVLEGQFKAHWAYQTLMLVWFCFLVLFVLMTFIVWLIRGDWKAFGVSLGAGVLGAAVLGLERWLARQDVAFLSEAIRRSIGDTGT